MTFKVSVFFGSGLSNLLSSRVQAVRLKWTVCCVFASFVVTPLAVAWETDQYTLPDKPLVDIGPDVSRYVLNNLNEALAEVNKALAEYPAELQRLRQHPYAQRGYVLSFNPRYRHRARANDLLDLRRSVVKRERALENFSSEPGIAVHISAAIGRPIAVQEKIDGIFGLPTMFSPEWAERADFVDTYFRPSGTDHVYALAGFHRGLHAAYFILSSTINVYGIELGMDKLGHLFNEGLGYYEEYLQAIEAGLQPPQAVEKAIEWGVHSEAGRFGIYASGVYSNGDLAANIAGLHFYLNLFEPIQLAGTHHPAIIEKVGGRYRVALPYRDQSGTFMQRFFSNHMNEALNPSRLEALQFLVIGPAIESRCKQWLKRWPDRGSDWYAAERQRLQRWYGIDYGHDSNNTSPLDKLCFKEPAGK